MPRHDHEDDYQLRLRLPKRKPTPSHNRLPRLRFGKRIRGRVTQHARGQGTTLWSATPHLQRSTVKASYATNGKTPWSAHGTYLAREGAQREGEKGRGFTAEREDLDIAQTLARWQQAGDPHHFRFIVSPEQAVDLDLRQHARELLQQMEKDVGTPLEWIAIDHHNTAHPHVHVLVRGRDAAGQPLILTRQYIREGIRQRSQELATNHLGYRLEHDILQARAQVIERDQFTEIDRTLLRRADVDRLVTYEGTLPTNRAQQVRRLQEIQRLQYLSRVGLAEKVGSKTWQLAVDLESTLRAHQRSTDILKTRAQHHTQLTNPHAAITLTTLTPGMTVHGRLVGTGLDDEGRDQRYLLIEANDGTLHYLQQPPAVQRARGNGTLRIGNQLTLTGKQFTKNGRTIAYVELTMEHDRERSFPTLETLRAHASKPIDIETPVHGAQYRGRLVSYATGTNGEHYAVLDTGRELRALAADEHELTVGHDIRARAREVIDEDNRRTRTLIWRFEDLEQERARQHDHGRSR